GSPTGGGHVVRRRVMQLIEVVVPVHGQHETPARRVPESTAERKCKRGAEGVGVVFDRTAAAADSGTKIQDRNYVMETFLSGQIERQVDVVQVDRHIVAAQLSGRPRLGRIDCGSRRVYV